MPLATPVLGRLHLNCDWFRCHAIGTTIRRLNLSRRIRALCHPPLRLAATQNEGLQPWRSIGRQPRSAHSLCRRPFGSYLLRASLNFSSVEMFCYANHLKFSSIQIRDRPVSQFGRIERRPGTFISYSAYRWSKLRTGRILCSLDCGRLKAPSASSRGCLACLAVLGELECTQVPCGPRSVSVGGEPPRGAIRQHHHARRL